MRQSVKTTCSYCGVGCGLEVARDAAGMLSLRGDAEHPVNRGMLCSKGRCLHHTVQDRSGRILHPEMRWSRAHPRVRVGWDTAMRRAAAVFGSIIERHGPRAVGFYVSGQMLTEEYYVANKLVKGFLGCNNIDTNSRLCMSTAVAAYKMALGDDLVPNSYEDIEHADCMLIAGANPAWCHPILFRRMEQRKASAPGTKVIVVDPRRTDTCELADLHLQIRPGSDVRLYLAIARMLLDKGAVDRAFVTNHAEGYGAFAATLAGVDLIESAAQCGISLAQVDEAATMIAQSRALLSFWAMGLNQSRHGVDKNLALFNINLMTGNIGRKGAGIFSLTGQPNAMGGREVGGMANMLAAHHDLANPEHRAKVARFWGVDKIDAEPGLKATEMFEALEEGRLKAIWIVCTNPAVSMPNHKRIARALNNARFVVVQDISHKNETAEFADLLLPAAGWLEKSGAMTNSERRVSLLSKLVDPPGEALPDAEILCRFARAMGFGEAFNYKDESEIFAEHAALTAGTAIDMSGITHARLRAEGSLQWPCPATHPNQAAHPGTPRLFSDLKFATPSGRAKFWPIAPPEAGVAPNARYPFILTTGRIRDQWHTMTRTGKVSRLRKHIDLPLLEIHPDDAAALGLANGQAARVESPEGAVETRALLTTDIKPGVVFLPMHWGKALNGGTARANNLTSSRVDPRSGEPDFKYSIVSVRPIKRAPQRLVVVGSGAAALEFVRAYRKLNEEDSIAVFGREPFPFYNRVQLPDYMTGAAQWDAMQSSGGDELETLKVDFQCGAGVTMIDAQAHEVEDELGNHHPYDKLILATGSRAALPADVPRDLHGIFCLRTRGDADRIVQSCKPGAHAVIVGGGLLGLETAAALDKLGLKATILHRSDRLMRAQLDPLAAEMLKEQIEERGIQVILNDVVEKYHGRERLTRIQTRGGRHLDCDLLLIAAGTAPNAELGRALGLAGTTGIAVDAQMRTSNPAVFAVGEVAEFEGRRCGTTSAAQAQARAAAAAVAGDPLAQYEPYVEFNNLKIEGIRLIAVGETQLLPGANVEEIVFLDRKRREYRKCVLKDGRLAGAILMGATNEFSQLHALISSGVELEELRDTLLRGGGEHAGTPCEGALVCSCHNVGEGNLAGAMQEGCDSLEGLMQLSKAGTGCGSCRAQVKRFWNERRQALEVVA